MMGARLMVVYDDGRIELQDTSTDKDILALCVRHVPPFDGADPYWCLTFGDIILHVSDSDTRPTVAAVEAEWRAKKHVSCMYIDGVKLFS